MGIVAMTPTCLPGRVALVPAAGIFLSNRVKNRLYCFCNVYKLSIFEVLNSI